MYIKRLENTHDWVKFGLQNRQRTMKGCLRDQYPKKNRIEIHENGNIIRKTVNVKTN